MWLGGAVATKDDFQRVRESEAQPENSNATAISAPNVMVFITFPLRTSKRFASVRISGNTRAAIALAEPGRPEDVRMTRQRGSLFG